MTELTLLRPAWLLALIPWLLWWWQGRRRQPLLAAPLAHYLYAAQPGPRPWRPLAALLMIAALSGPALPRAEMSFSGPPLDVWLLDLSSSMLATDPAPDRATRARLLLQDLLALDDGRRVALILFAADAYLAMPPTQDKEALGRLLPDLTPDVMPIQGSAPDRAVRLALTRLGAETPVRLLLITDQINAAQQASIRQDWPCQRGALSPRCDAPRLDIVLLAGDRVAQLPANQGRLALPPPDRAAIAALAESTGGVLMSSDRDPELLSPLGPGPRRQHDSGWLELGPYLLLLLLPFALLARRGTLWGLLLVALLQPPPLHAAPSETALRLYRQGEYAAAAQAFDDPIWRGNAWYRAGEYLRAAEAYAEVSSATAHYNRGNALAHLGQLKEAQEAYEATLALEPNHEDASYNLALLRRQQTDAPTPSGEAPKQAPQARQEPATAPPVVLLKERLRKLAERAPTPPVGEPW
ncbi:tetratricopeptide repeat protein [Aeromonas diversa]|uniref:tetratricopeptide repeat protein n=1 Tax=Aeromonas diversa TaxID=502790 RepID=UPI003462FA66